MKLTSTEMGIGCGEQGRGGGADQQSCFGYESQNDFRHLRGDAEETVGFLSLVLKGQVQAASEKGGHLKPRTGGSGSRKPSQGRVISIWHLGKTATPSLWPLQTPS